VRIFLITRRYTMLPAFLQKHPDKHIRQIKCHSFPVFLLISMIILSCSGKPETRLRNLERAYNDQDIEKIVAGFADDVYIEIGDRLIFKNDSEIRDFLEFFTALRSHIHFSNMRAFGDTIKCDMAESNDWLVGSGLGKGLYRARFQFDDSRIKWAHIELTEDTRQNFNQLFSGFQEWLKKKKPAIASDMIPGDRIEYSADNAAFLLASLKEWTEEVQGKKPVSVRDFEDVMDIIGIKRGMVVADVGAGDGYFTVQIARRVGENGRVYANDITNSLLKQIEKRCGQEGIHNVFTVLGKETDANLPVKFDMIFMRHTLHCMTKPASWLKNAGKYLKPGARLVIIDGDPDIMGYGWAYENTREEVLRMADEAGFVLERLETVLLPEDYIYLFKMRRADEG
jgi:SAM-dependent methyltransferase